MTAFCRLPRSPTQRLPVYSTSTHDRRDAARLSLAFSADAVRAGKYRRPNRHEQLFAPYGALVRAHSQGGEGKEDRANAGRGGVAEKGSDEGVLAALAALDVPP